MKDKLVSLKLYITGQTSRSEQAIVNLRRLCETYWADDYTIDIIDVLEQPRLAEENGIVATPTLIKVAPPPVRRLIGDLSATRKVLVGLGLRWNADNEI
ncbi:MAG: circadian clock KaiB family protein [Anaerolineae bacterium]